MTNAKTNVATDAGARTITVSRTFAAPRERVFRAFTEPEHLAHWWGPDGWQVETLAHELVPGGVWHFVLRGPDGTESWSKATYQEITPPARLVYSDVFSDREGNTVEGMPVMVVTIDFVERDGKTTVTDTTQFPSEEVLQQVVEMGVAEGITQTWERLAVYLGRE
ncbi:MAG: hypothetical protein AVDCRST_MAG18-3113 [uncultured Thermomicrobiales bacterium]|uniref:Activator of Hsp90 ATPase homologue 1/2-like C-terminal domain-containing protein n=1 Tax=uncultured Thermomicrobiales bacterium TaxID=1645740 RepID=A0A6J4VKB1_9BACT|nr:MAG: hypothetical protein AVDCRST_MAG18-3113 [uncultured Thermomicrobiales bacterium]